LIVRPRIVLPEAVGSDIIGIAEVALTLTCISEGGFPEQTLDWFTYRIGQIPLQLKTCSTNSVVNQDLYDVTNTCTMTPTRDDDGAMLFCQSSYHGTPEMTYMSDNVTMTLLCK